MSRKNVIKLFFGFGKKRIDIYIHEADGRRKIDFVTTDINGSMKWRPFGYGIYDFVCPENGRLSVFNYKYGSDVIGYERT